MVYSRAHKISFSKLLQQRLDITTEILWIPFEGHYTPIERNMSRKFSNPFKLNVKHCDFRAAAAVFLVAVVGYLFLRGSVLV